MITTTLLVILGVALIVVIFLMMRSPTGARAKKVLTQPIAFPKPEPTGAVNLLDAKPGDVVSIHAGAEDYSDLDFTIDRRSAYQTAGRKWIDLSGDFRGRRVYLEVQSGQELEVLGLLDARKLTLADVRTTEEQLADFDAKQNPWLYIEFESKRWLYESSRELGYFENEQGEGEGLYRWSFREAEGDRVLVIEKWEGEPFDVRIARRLPARDISVYKSA